MNVANIKPVLASLASLRTAGAVRQCASMAVSLAILAALSVALGEASAATLLCNVKAAFQLSDIGALTLNEQLTKTWSDAFYVDNISGKVTGGPMSTEGWGETVVYAVQKYQSFTVLSFTHGSGTNRGVRLLYVNERRSTGEHSFQVSEGTFSYSGLCKLQ